MTDSGISVIIPAFNASKTIVRCINSVITDDFCREVIVINDGSSDDTESIVRELARCSNKIRLHSTPNSGVSVARNLGIRLAKQEYLFFLDSDDFLANNSISESARFTKSNELDLCCFEMTIKNNNKEVRQTRLKDNIVLSKNKDIGDFLQLMNIKSSCGKIYRKSLIINNGIYFKENIDYSEDYIFVMNYLMYVNSVGLSIKSVYYIQNVNRDSLSKIYHNNIEYILEERNIALNNLLIRFPSYKEFFKKMELNIDYYSFIVICDNLFKKGSPYNFFENIKLIRTYLDEFNDRKIYLSTKDLPKKLIQKLYVLTVKSNSAILLAILFKIKNIIKRYVKSL